MAQRAGWRQDKIQNWEEGAPRHLAIMSPSWDYVEMSIELSKQDLAELTQISAWRGPVHLALHGLLILALGAATLGLHWGFLFPLGLSLGALFPCMHEATHRHILRSPGGNALIARVCGIVLLLPSIWFRHFHQAHHRYTQDPERDPELATPRPQSPAAYLWHLTGLPAWASALTLLIRQALCRPLDPFVPHFVLSAVRNEGV